MMKLCATRKYFFAGLAVLGLTAANVQADSMIFSDNSSGNGVLYDVAIPNSEPLSFPFDTRSYGDAGRIRWPGNGYMIMDSATSGGFALNEADVALDLAGYTDVWLTFNQRSWSDEVHTFGSSPDFTDQYGDHYYADGVMISEDGQTWKPIWEPDANESKTSQYAVSIDLSQAVANAGFSLTNPFNIRFQQYDNYSKPSDGRGWDWIMVYGTPGGPSPGAAVPEPSSIALLGIGLVGLAGYGWRRKRKTAK